MFFELRQYRARPGQRENWVRFMEDVIVPFQVSKGMVIVGSWTGEQEDDLFVWMRRFDNESERERLYKEVYESEHWKTNVAPRIPEMLDREKMVITRLEPTARSVIR
jgi:NIPSNAP protein